MNDEIEKLLNILGQGYHRESALILAELIESSTFENRAGPAYINLPNSLKEISLTSEERLTVANRLFAFLNQNYEGDTVSILWILCKTTHRDMLDQAINLASAKAMSMTKEEVNQLLILIDNLVSIASSNISDIHKKTLSDLLKKLHQTLEDNDPINGNISRLILGIETKVGL